MPRRKQPRKQPQPEKALADLSNLIETPRQKNKSPLEEFVEQNFDLVLKAVKSEYSLTQICALLGKNNITANTKSLKVTMNAVAAQLNRLDELPPKLKIDSVNKGESSDKDPTPEDPTPEVEAQSEPSFDELINAPAQEKPATQTANTNGRFNKIGLDK